VSGNGYTDRIEKIKEEQRSISVENKLNLSTMKSSEKKIEITLEKENELREGAKKYLSMHGDKDKIYGRYRDPEARKEIEMHVKQFLSKREHGISTDVINELTKLFSAEVGGFGRIDHLLDDDSITEIIFDFGNVAIEKDGKLRPINLKFQSNDEVNNLANRFLESVNREIDYVNPIEYARLPDGSRVTIILDGIAIDGTRVCIRKHKEGLAFDDLIEFGSISTPMKRNLEKLVKARYNQFVSGGTGSGKTTFVNLLAGCFEDHLHIITIEDIAELSFDSKIRTRLETRPSKDEKNEITVKQLTKVALRLRPDIIVIGEVRGEEAHYLLVAYNSDHQGSMSTGHANTCKDAISKLTSYVLSAGIIKDEKTSERDIANSLELVYQLSRLNDGSRKVVEICEVDYDEENQKTVLRTLCEYQQDSYDGNVVKGKWVHKNDIKNTLKLEQMNLELEPWGEIVSSEVAS
jgi:pilus assembly protein CpaF